MSKSIDSPTEQDKCPKCGSGKVTATKFSCGTDVSTMLGIWQSGKCEELQQAYQRGRSEALNKVQPVIDELHTNLIHYCSDYEEKLFESILEIGNDWTR